MQTWGDRGVVASGRGGTNGRWLETGEGGYIWDSMHMHGGTEGGREAKCRRDMT